jgi:lipopolysaccharide transport system ATP-binding protein
MMFIGVAMVTLHPRIVHFYERDVVAFQVVDSIDGDSARGDWAGGLAGVVRPLLKWTTQFTPNHRETAARATEEAKS